MHFPIETHFSALPLRSPTNFLFIGNCSKMFWISLQIITMITETDQKGSHPSTESTEPVLAQKGVLPILDYHFVSNDLEELI